MIGFLWQVVVVGGIGLVMFFIVMVLQLMCEKGMSCSEVGQLGFLVLLFQDLVVILVLVLVFLLVGLVDEYVNWLMVGMKVLVFVGMLIGGCYLLWLVFCFIVSLGVREVFIVVMLLLVFGFVLFMEVLGLLMVLGIFIVGVLLVESEYCYELEIVIDLFKGLLFGLFFIFVGMVLNFGVLYIYLLWVVVSVVVLVVVKMLVFYLLVCFYGL